MSANSSPGMSEPFAAYTGCEHREIPWSSKRSSRQSRGLHWGLNGSERFTSLPVAGLDIVLMRPP